MHSDSTGTVSGTARTIALGLGAVALLSTFVLPSIALDTRFADLVVLLTNTASTTGFPLLAIAVVCLVAMRRGIGGKRRALEAGTVLLVMSATVISVTLFNEHVIKPLIGVPRPNIVELADSGALGPEFPDADAFYGVGDKNARRTVLAARLPELETPSLSDAVRDHWAHETGYSFPSGHSVAASTLATVIAGFALMWLTGRARSVALTIILTWAIGVAYSRVLLEVHRPLDVIAGSIVGLGCGMLVLAALRAVLLRVPDD